MKPASLASLVIALVLALGAPLVSGGEIARGRPSAALVPGAATVLEGEFVAVVLTNPVNATFASSDVGDRIGSEQILDDD